MGIKVNQLVYIQLPLLKTSLRSIFPSRSVLLKQQPETSSMLSILLLFCATHYITSTFREQQYFPFYVHEFAKVFFFLIDQESQFKFTSLDSKVDFLGT